jgi:hypothetical protein
MNKQIALEKVNSLVLERRLFKNSKVYRTIIHAIENPNTPVVCGQNTGSGRHAGSESWYARTAMILDQIGVNYQYSNVAPKGGKNGDRVTVIINNE